MAKVKAKAKSKPQRKPPLQSQCAVFISHNALLADVYKNAWVRWEIENHVKGEEEGVTIYFIDADRASNLSVSLLLPQARLLAEELLWQLESFDLDRRAALPVERP